MVAMAQVDILKYAQQIGVCLLSAIILTFIYFYWDRFVMLFTGDDRLHCSSLDCIWATIRCNGYCNGEWTRSLSMLPCFPQKYRGRNLVKVFGQMLGIATHSIEIKNIVIGDLPFDQGRGDFYLSIECATNPPMVTALQEEKLAKLVHFPEILTLKIRDSALEKRVRIIVKELNVLGSEELCDIHLSPASIIDWAAEVDQEQRVRRFRLRPFDNSIERETPAWILIEFAESDDVRGVETHGISGESKYVRTWVPTTDPTVAMSATNPHPIAYTQNLHGDAETQGSTSMWGGTSNSTWAGPGSIRQNVDLKVEKFKHEYQLLDDTGNPVQEVPESDLARLKHLRQCAIILFGLYQFVVWILIIGLAFGRLYTCSCYRAFTAITIAKLQQKTFPIPLHALHNIVEECHKQFSGTGLSRGTNPVTAASEICRPNVAAILGTCQVPPPDQPAPQAFIIWLKQYFDITVKHGVPCHGAFGKTICELRETIAQYDYFLIGGIFLLFLSTFVCKCALNNCIKSYKRTGQKKAKLESKKNKETAADRQGRR